MRDQFERELAKKRVWGREGGSSSKCRLMWNAWYMTIQTWKYWSRGRWITGIWAFPWRKLGFNCGWQSRQKCQLTQCLESMDTLFWMLYPHRTWDTSRTFLHPCPSRLFFIFWKNCGTREQGSQRQKATLRLQDLVSPEAWGDKKR